MSLQEQEIKTQDHIAKYYEHIRYKVSWSKCYHDWLFGRMIKRLQPHGKVLDAGCGNGLLAEYLPGEKVWGVDISPEMIKLAKKRLHEAKVANIENLPFEDNFFDTIFARAIIHHLENPERGVKELARVLKPGGRIIFLDTRETILSRLPRKKMTEGEHFSELHHNMNEKSYLEMISKNLRVEKKEYVGYIGYTFLGFPDVFNIYKFIPGKFLWTPLLIKIDTLWSKIPLLNKLALSILVVARKKDV